MNPTWPYGERLRALEATGYTARPVTRSDFSSVVDLLTSYDIVDFGKPDHVAPLLRDEWSRPRFDPTNDSWLVEAQDGTPVGYGHVLDEESDAGPRAEVTIRIHPDHRDHGIGSALLEASEGWARARVNRDGAPLTLLNVITAADDGAARLLAGAGYQVVRHFWHMEIDLRRDLPPVSSPHGVRIRNIAPGEERSVHALMQGAFENDWQGAPGPFEQWTAQLGGRDAFDPELWLVAQQDNEIVGAVINQEWDGDGWVSLVGIAPSHRRRGLGAALLHRSFDAFRQRGYPTAMLNVDAGNETGATDLYERVGMRIRRRWDVYEKKIQP